MKYAQKTAQRSVFNNGKGASAVGLTAAVKKDAVTKEWTLEGGALVLADRGICLIDEFDKMNDQDRVSIHEAMEQQTISLSKAGIVTQLKARCAVIAAANPIGGKYDIRIPFSENVQLEDPIISRFDCLCVITDKVDEIQDRKIAKFLISVHRDSHPDNVKQGDEIGEVLKEQNDNNEDVVHEDDPDVIPQDLLRKYIIYAKSYAMASFNKENSAQYEEMVELLTNVYKNLRKECDTVVGLNITVRHLESMIRMAEAHAKMHIRSNVNVSDIHLAVRMMTESFITAQKLSVQITLRKRLYKYLNIGKGHEHLFLEQLTKMTNAKIEEITLLDGEIPEKIEITMTEAIRKAKNLKLDMEAFLNSKIFEKSVFIYNRQNDTFETSVNRL